MYFVFFALVKIGYAAGEIEKRSTAKRLSVKKNHLKNEKMASMTIKKLEGRAERCFINLL